MRVFPALDLREGRCVRLEQGEFARMTSYSDDPCEVALQFQESGATALHVVDLDGAKSGRPQQLELAARIRRSVRVPVQLGGGMRSRDDVQAALDAGIWRVVLGSALVRDTGLGARLVAQFGDAVLGAIEVRDGQMRLHGWQEAASVSALEVLRRLAGEGVRGFLCTDVSRDGMLCGPALDWYRELRSAQPGVELLASGGIGSVEDVSALKRLGLDGAIVGKALYEGRFKLSDALEAALP